MSELAQPGGSMVRPGHTAFAAALLAVGAPALATLAPERAAIPGAAFGVLGHGIAYLALWSMARAGTNALFAAFAVGFLARMVLVAIGLFPLSGRGPLLWFTFAFFGVTLAALAVEVTLVHAAGRSARPGGPSVG